MHNKVLSLLLGAALLAATAPAAADVPRTINFQGRLANSQLQVLDGNYEITLRIFAGVAGTACHSETRTVTVSDGLFSVRIGETSGISTSCIFGESNAIELAVKNSSAVVETLAPRIPLSAVPYAMASYGLVKTSASVVRAGNASGNVPVSNTILNAGLHADYFNGFYPFDHNNPGLGGDIWMNTHSHKAVNLTTSMYACGTQGYLVPANFGCTALGTRYFQN